MQEVDLTSQLLLDFSIAFGRIPTVTIEIDADDGATLPFNVLILGAWFLDLVEKDENSYMMAFQAYLAGRDMFVLPELTGKEFLKLLATTIAKEARLLNDS